MPIHITLQQGFALRNAVYMIDAILPSLFTPILLIVVMWLGRRGILRAIKWSAILALVFDLLDLLAVVGIMLLQPERYQLRLAYTFTLDAMYNIWGVAEQCALTTAIVVAAVSLLACAQRRQWGWFVALAALISLTSIGHALLGSASLLVRNTIPLDYLPQQIFMALVAALLPIAALLLIARSAGNTSVSPAIKAAPSHDV